MIARHAVPLLVTLALAGCDSFFVEPEIASGDPGIGLALQLSTAAPTGPISEKVEVVRVTITRDDGFARDTLLALQRVFTTQPRARLLLQPSEVAATLTVGAVLMGGGHVYYEGRGVVDPRGGVPPSLQLTMQPWIGRVEVAAAHRTFDALGETVEVEASVLFPSGDQIPGLEPRWASSDPSVVSVTADGTAVSVGNGEAVLTATYGEFSSSTAVTVDQVAVRVTAITPANPVVVAGHSIQLTAEGVDRLGHPLVKGATLDWAAQTVPKNVLTISRDGVCLGRHAGTATVRAVAGPSQATAEVTVIAPSSGEPPVLAFAGTGGLFVGDLGGEMTLLVPGQGIVSPAWAPDHRHIAFVQGGLLFITSLQGDVTQVETGGLNGVEWPEYSASGDGVYFSNKYSSNYSIYLAGLKRPNSGPWVQLAGARMPSTSPVDESIVHVRGGELSIRDYGRPLPRVVLQGAFPATPVWSPDGSWIAFLGLPGKVVNLVHPDGSSRRRIEGHGLLDGISWSPDARWLIGFDSNGVAGLVAVSTGQMFDLPWSFRGQVAWWR